MAARVNRTSPIDQLFEGFPRVDPNKRRCRRFCAENLSVVPCPLNECARGIFLEVIQRLIYDGPAADMGR